MSPRNQQKSSIDRFRALVIHRFDTLDVRKSNRAYDQLSQLRREIHAAAEEERRRILLLLDDPHPAVRLAAAFDALSIEPDEGVRVLRELAAGPRSAIRLDAERTLQRYEAGVMDLRPWDKPRPDDNDNDDDEDAEA